MPSFVFPLEQQEFVLRLLARYEVGPSFFCFVLYSQKHIAIAMYMAAFSSCHRSCHKKNEELSSIKCLLLCFTRFKSPCLLTVTYHDSQPYLVLLHVHKVERAILYFLAAEKPSCVPSYANDFQPQRGFPLPMRKEQLLEQGFKNKSARAFGFLHV